MWATPRASRRATFPRFMPLAPPAARLSRACEPLDARDHPSVTRWLSRQNRGSVAADRGSREETCTSQPFAPRGPAGVVAAGLSGVDPAPNGAPREPHRAARLALGKRPRLDREAEAEPSGSTSAANARTFFRSMAHAVSSASETSSGGVSVETKKMARKTNQARAALDPRDIDEGVAWLRRCHARLVRVVATVVVARARARARRRARRARAARGAEAAGAKPFLYRKRRLTTRARRTARACVRTRPIALRGFRGRFLPSVMVVLTTQPRASRKTPRRTAWAAWVRSRAPRAARASAESRRVEKTFPSAKPPPRASRARARNVCSFVRRPRRREANERRRRRRRTTTS